MRGWWGAGGGYIHRPLERERWVLGDYLVHTGGKLRPREKRDLPKTATDPIQQAVPKPVGHQAESSALNKGLSCLSWPWFGGTLDTRTDKHCPEP